MYNKSSVSDSQSMGLLLATLCIIKLLFCVFQYVGYVRLFYALLTSLSLSVTFCTFHYLHGKYTCV